MPTAPSRPTAVTEPCNRPPETCDQGAANSATAYGASLCTNLCKPAPYCGNKSVDGQFGETCDDGMNTGLPGSCSTNCKQFIPLVTCGNGVVNPRSSATTASTTALSAAPVTPTVTSSAVTASRTPASSATTGPTAGLTARATPTARSPGTAATASRTAPSSATTAPPACRPRPRMDRASARRRASSRLTAATGRRRRSSASSAMGSRTARRRARSRWLTESLFNRLLRARVVGQRSVSVREYASLGLPSLGALATPVKQALRASPARASWADR